MRRLIDVLHKKMGRGEAWRFDATSDGQVNVSASQMTRYALGPDSNASTNMAILGFRVEGDRDFIASLECQDAWNFADAGYTDITARNNVMPDHLGGGVTLTPPKSRVLTTTTGSGFSTGDTKMLSEAGLLQVDLTETPLLLRDADDWPATGEVAAVLTVHAKSGGVNVSWHFWGMVWQ